jgi:hypothetical protein
MYIWQVLIDSIFFCGGALDDAKRHAAAGIKGRVTDRRDCCGDIELAQTDTVIKALSPIFSTLSPIVTLFRWLAHAEGPVLDIDNVVADGDASSFLQAVEAVVPDPFKRSEGILTDLRERQFLKAPMPKEDDIVSGSAMYSRSVMNANGVISRFILRFFRELQFPDRLAAPERAVVDCRHGVRHCDAGET